MQAEELYGRQLCLTPAEAREMPATTVKLPSMQVTKTLIQCCRCGSDLNRQLAQLPAAQFYCYQCLTLGRVSTLTSLYHIPEPNKFKADTTLTWTGQLTAAQATCAAELQQHFSKREQHLLWAVTGAGKTEMLFPGIAWALAQGWRVALASPRVDVCLELYPRLQAAFAHLPIALLHGHNPAPYQYCQLTICTTHQLLRFRAAFDVLIIDEVDAFPFAANPRLAYAVKQARKPESALLYLTATPSQALLKQVRHRTLSISYLPLRFHQHLLPPIRVSLQPRWWAQFQQGHLPTKLRRWLQQYVTVHQRFLIFVPRITQLAVVQQVIATAFPTLKGLTVHAADAQRLEKVQAMRTQQVQYLVTTTILERGVTFPGIDVIVLGADDAVFSTAALVQIAGRAGRSAQRPTGLVRMVVSHYTRPLKAAQRQIKQVNRKGRRLRAKMSTLSATTEV